jgi:hypothetical protein
LFWLRFLKGSLFPTGLEIPHDRQKFFGITRRASGFQDTRKEPEKLPAPADIY